MASLAHSSDGSRTIQFVSGDRKRRTIRLGRVSKRMAENVCRHVEELVAAKLMGQPVAAQTAAWVADLDDRMYDRLAAVQLLAPRCNEPAMGLGTFLAKYVRERVDVKPATKEVWSQVVRNLNHFFGSDRSLAEISESDADAFKMYLNQEALSATTIQKRLQFARMFFKAAGRAKLIGANPFAEVSGKAVIRSDRQSYVTREEIDRILTVCDPNWQAIVGLARFGGLRCPSEVLSVRWADIDWESSKVTVTSPKTAHHEGKGSRVIPLFPELRDVLRAAQKIAEPAAEYVIAGYRESSLTEKGWRNCNLRTQFERIVKRAGLSVWPRLFHALRASRETELAREFPLHVVTSWLGNSPKIAVRHYLMVTENDFERAAKSAAAPVSTEPHQQETPADSTCDKAEFTGVCDVVQFSAPSTNGEDRIRTCGRLAPTPI
jgi:integrase